MLNDLERKFGRYAIPHLINYLIGGYAIGYLLYFMSMVSGFSSLVYLTFDPYKIIHHLQLWRVISWVLIPPLQNPIFALIMMFFYWQLGNMLEATWGTFRFNLYIFGGIFFTVLGGFISYGIYYVLSGTALLSQAGLLVAAYTQTTYINMSIFLAYALSYPDMTVLLCFIIPVKMKWMALLYGIWALYGIFTYSLAGKICLIASLLNFVIFYFGTKNYRSISPQEFKRKQAFKRKVNSANAHTGGTNPYGGTNPFGKGPTSIARHKCAICGRTDISNPELEFRFCSKCNGNYEYCNDHLFTHTHVQ